MNVSILATLVFALALSACSSAPRRASPSTEAPVAESSRAKGDHAPSLTHLEAVGRARQIAQTSYSLWFRLDSAATEYEGRAVVNFDLRHRGKDAAKKLFLDFEDGQIRFISLNGTMLPAPSIDKSRYDGHRIHLRAEELKPGTNRIEIAFSHAYSANGNGLYRFKDPVDGKTYIYSNSEPFSANRIFPCFDQPDLKATFELTVEVPEGWEVVSNTPPREVSTVDGRKSWAFPNSPVFSTYLFAMIAGPWQVWKSDADGIPLRLLARRSLGQYVDAKEIFDITRQGLELYNVHFGYPYPYAKYDQIFVPDFNSAGMENVAAVTLHEPAIFRTKVTRDRRRNRAELILHEMAHQWFGDLVTMKWWNGLWLNESFADFMAHWSMAKLDLYPGGWQSFFTRSKGWAYWQDQLVTTHPIEVPVPDTDTALSNFDGITYGKGASALKQLSYFLDEDNFREGIQRYFQRYALRNTTIHEFFKMLSEASSQDLSRWQQAWLQTAGVNTVRADWACALDATGKSVISKFELVQSPSEASPEVLRPHRTEVALYSSQKKALRATDTIAVTYSKAQTPVPTALGKPCPDLVYPNHNDQDYVKVELDPVSLRAASQGLARIAEPFARAMLWYDLWQMVVDGKLSASDYANIAIAQLGSETDTDVLSRTLRTLNGNRRSSESVLTYLTGPAWARVQYELEGWMREHLLSAPAGSDHQLIWLQAYLTTAHSAKASELVHDLLSGKRKLKGLAIDQERRWELVEALARIDVPSRMSAAVAQAMIQAELKNDPTDFGQKHAIAAEAAIPDTGVKQAWADKILRANPSNVLPVAKLREAMRNFHLIGQEDTSRAFVETYFKELPRIAGLDDEAYAHDFTSLMYPSLCDPAVVKQTTDLLSSHSDLPVHVQKALKVSRQEEERCIRARAKAG